MNINSEGLAIIKDFEGYSASVYQCPGGIWTIGWGATWDINGDPVTADHPAIDKDIATQLLSREVAHAEYAVNKLIKAELTENMFSACVSLAYNIGSGNFQASTLRSKLNRGDYQGAADEFPKWRRSGGKILAGLVRRRAAERALFLT